MGLVHNDTLRGDGEEVGAVAVALDVVETDDHDGVVLEKRNAGGKIFFETRDAGRSERDRLKVEMTGELAAPLVNEVRRAKHSEAGDFATVVQLSRDHAGLDGFADTNIVRDE